MRSQSQESVIWKKSSILKAEYQLNVFEYVYKYVTSITHPLHYCQEKKPFGTQRHFKWSFSPWRLKEDESPPEHVKFLLIDVLGRQIMYPAYVTFL